MATTATVPEGGPPKIVVRPSDIVDLVSTDERTIVDLRGLGPFMSIGRYRYLAAHDDVELQRHERLLVLALPLRSRFDFLVDDQVISAGPSEVICIPPGSAYSAGIGSAPRGELLWLTVAVDPAGRGDTAPARGLSLNEALHALVGSGTRVWTTSSLSIELLVRVVSLSQPRDPVVDAWRFHLCASAVLELLQSQRSHPSEEVVMHPAIRRALDCIEERLFESVTVGDLIKASELSATHFYQLFVHMLGTTPKDYLLRAKIDAACELLTTTDRTVTAIAHELGFSSSQHFAGVFRRYVGRSPSEYRTGRPVLGGPSNA